MLGCETEGRSATTKASRRCDGERRSGDTQVPAGGLARDELVVRREDEEDGLCTSKERVSEEEQGGASLWEGRRAKEQRVPQHGWCGWPWLRESTALHPPASIRRRQPVE